MIYTLCVCVCFFLIVLINCIPCVKIVQSVCILCSVSACGKILSVLLHCSHATCTCYEQWTYSTLCHMFDVVSCRLRQKHVWFSFHSTKVFRLIQDRPNSKAQWLALLRISSDLIPMQYFCIVLCLYFGILWLLPNQTSMLTSFRIDGL
jgi:hypothetical protein